MKPYLSVSLIEDLEQKMTMDGIDGKVIDIWSGKNDEFEGLFGFINGLQELPLRLGDWAKVKN